MFLGVKLQLTHALQQLYSTKGETDLQLNQRCSELSSCFNALIQGGIHYAKKYF